MWQLQQLEQFRAVYERGSLSAAARALGLTQPALSRGLQKLEAEVGAALFQRHTRALRPTQFAHQLYRQSVRVLNETAGLDRVVERFQRGREGLVRLGCGPFVPDILMLGLAAGLQRLGEHIHLDVHTDQFDALREGLYGYAYDFLVYDGRRRSGLDPDDVVVESLLNLPLKVVAPAHWLRGEARAAATDEAAAREFVAERPWAMPRVAPEYRDHVRTWFRDQLIGRRGAEFIMPTSSSCLALCRAGRALTLSPEILIETDRAAGILAVLPLDVGASVETCAYRLRSRPLSDAAARVWRVMVEASRPTAG